MPKTYVPRSGIDAPMHELARCLLLVPDQFKAGMQRMADRHNEFAMAHGSWRPDYDPRTEFELKAKYLWNCGTVTVHLDTAP